MVYSYILNCSSKVDTQRLRCLQVARSEKCLLPIVYGEIFEEEVSREGVRV